MPIYEYRCTNCGHQQEFLQRLGDAPRTRCTKCGLETFSKMVTAAGFQLKGSGWYATDFKSSGSAPASKPDDAGKAGGAAAKPEGGTESRDKGAGSPGACGSGACPACS